jgi:hypothetical protein
MSEPCAGRVDSRPSTVVDAETDDWREPPRESEAA